MSDGDNPLVWAPTSDAVTSAEILSRRGTIIMHLWKWLRGQISVSSFMIGFHLGFKNFLLCSRWYRTGRLDFFPSTHGIECLFPMHRRNLSILLWGRWERTQRRMHQTRISTNALGGGMLDRLEEPKFEAEENGTWAVVMKLKGNRNQKWRNTHQEGYPLLTLVSWKGLLLGVSAPKMQRGSIRISGSLLVTQGFQGHTEVQKTIFQKTES